MCVSGCRRRRGMFWESLCTSRAAGRQVQEGRFTVQHTCTQMQLRATDTQTHTQESSSVFCVWKNMYDYFFLPERSLSKGMAACQMQTSGGNLGWIRTQTFSFFFSLKKTKVKNLQMFMLNSLNCRILSGLQFQLMASSKHPMRPFC